MWTQVEYEQLMREAKIEFDQWEKDKKKNRKVSKATFLAKRLAKLHMMKSQFVTEL
jgi:hypothetical protein